MPDLTEDDLNQAALDPQSVTTDGQTATAHPLPDLIAFDKYVAAKRQARRKGTAWKGLRMAKAVPPGAVGQDS